MSNFEIGPHTRGESLFVGDLPDPPGVQHAAVLASPIPHGRIVRLDTSPAATVEGVACILTAADIPGENQIGGIVQDEPLLAEGLVHFRGQPIVVVVADDPATARRAAAAIEIEFEELAGVFDPREAAAAGSLIVPSRTFSLGAVEETWASCDFVIEGRADSGGQEHLYLEPQGALVLPQEGNRLRIISSTQAPTAVQRITARVLGLSMNDIEVDVARLGGAFGGKEDQATPWAAIAALAAFSLKRPVRIALSRIEDMRMTGKRHPYTSDYKIGLAENGRILAYEATFFQNAGAAADLSPAILERSLFHATGSYFVPNVRVTAMSCRTNLPPFTAFRGFGAPQAMFVMESAIARAADVMGIDRMEIQKINLIAKGEVFPYGMKAQQDHARRAFAETESRFDIAARRTEIDTFNRNNRVVKKGLSMMPVCFGISFTSAFLNQAAALVHVYTDGSVSVSTGAVEMGQGVNAKITNVAAHALGIDPALIAIETTNTLRVANTSPTAASSGADMNGKATEIACRTIVARLCAVAAESLEVEPERVKIVDGDVTVDDSATGLAWDELVTKAYFNRVSLSAQAHYATPKLHFDRTTGKGEPFAYHVYGSAAIEVTVDCLRGIYTVDRVSIVHDAGRSLDPTVDTGQLEGGLVQGIGWMTMEELVLADGRNLADTLSTYKIPDIYSAPEIEGHFLEDADNPNAVMHSKAIGEPPLMYGIGAYFALLDAMSAFRPDREPFFDAPMTPEKVLMFLHGDHNHSEIGPHPSIE
ncbi:MAG: molybdopterin-dependent oxidoreductase [Acidobacteria bacterium]|nr:molybdopterin-dependent oxidoreductase [Acidobacteriota bacterium]